MTSNNDKILDISWNTILKISLTLIVFYIIFQIKDILVWFLFAIIISVLFNPAIVFLRKLRIPRVAAVIFVYIGFFGFLSLFIYSSVVIFKGEILEFSQLFPIHLERISPLLQGAGIQIFENMESFIDVVKDSLERITVNIFNSLIVVFGNFFTTLFILTMAIFLSLEEGGIERSIGLFVPKKSELYALSLWRRCQKRVSAWFFTRIISCFFVGLVSYLVFLFWQVKYPFSFALIAGIFNFIPYAGPIVASLIFFVVIALEDMAKAVLVLIIFAIIQLIEGTVLTPTLSKKIIGLSPVLVLMALAVGGALWGFLGAFLAIPLLGIIFEFFKEFLEAKKKDKV